MTVASLDLCKQLSDYWPCNGETTYWVYAVDGDDWKLMRREDVVGAPLWVAAPDLGYLLRMLPDFPGIVKIADGE